MRPSLSIVVAIAALAAEVLAAPSLYTKRVSTVQVLQGYVNDASTAVTTDANSLNSTVVNSVNDVSAQAQVEIEAAAKANLADIATQLDNFAAEIEATTSSLSATLTEPEIIAFTATVEAADTLIVELYYTYIFAAEVFTADTEAAVSSEAAAAAAAVKLFSAPLVTYAGQVQEAGASDAGASVVALNAAASSLASASNNFSGAVGVTPSRV